MNDNDPFKQEEVKKPKFNKAQYWASKRMKKTKKKGKK